MDTTETSGIESAFIIYIVCVDIKKPLRISNRSAFVLSIPILKYAM